LTEFLLRTNRITIGAHKTFFFGFIQELFSPGFGICSSVEKPDGWNTSMVGKWAKSFSGTNERDQSANILN